MKFKKKVKAIILAGGSGTRLHPITKVFSKQLFPIYKKPMIYYPYKFISDLNVNEICFISDPKNIKNIKKIIRIYQKKKQKFHFVVQKKPKGLPEAFTLCKNFIKKDNVILLLGDNIFFDYDAHRVNSAFKLLNRNISTIFGYRVKDPRRFGVAEIGKNKKIKRVIEKPKTKVSNIAIVGLYFFTYDVIKNSYNLRPSKRKELEITDLMKIYLKQNRLNLEIFSKKTKWFDAGTFESILKVSNYAKKKLI